MRRGLGVVVGLCLLVVIGCRPDDHGVDFSPSLVWQQCPDQVEATFLSAHSCGYLTVLEDRTQPGGRTVRLLTIKVPPIGGTVRDGIGTSFGDNIGDPKALSGDMATGTTRMQRIGINLERRGAGPNSEPSLRCPEVDLLQGRVARSPTGDASLRAAFLDGVRRCFTRLREAGIDPSQYGSSAAAGDVEDLRVAVGVEQWAMASSYGTSSRSLFAYVRTYPDRVAAAYLDSPWFPANDDLSGGVVATRAALDAMFTACSSQQSCRHRHPDLRETWAQALRRLRTKPLVGTAQVGSGTVAVLVDDGTLLRMARFALGGDGPGNLTRLPGIIAEAAAGRLSSELARWVAEDPVFCAGYRPLCAGQDQFSLGVFLTTFCAEQNPVIDDRRLAEAIDGDPTYQAVFGDSPYREACRFWSVPAAGEPPVTTRGIPLLLLTGRFDAYSPPGTAAAEAAGADRVWALEDPGSTHNVLGFSPCFIAVRNAWTWDPTHPPDARSCRAVKPVRLR